MIKDVILDAFASSMYVQTTKSMLFAKDSLTLYQWDKGQELRLEDTGIEAAPEIHFANRYSREAIVVNSRLEGNAIVAPIPNSLLEEHHDILAYLYSNSASTCKTLKVVKISVIPRTKPMSYTPADNVTKVTAWSADFTGAQTLLTQFKGWTRLYGAQYVDVDNLELGYCEDGSLHLLSKYNGNEGKWYSTIRTTEGLFEADHGVIEFRAKFSNLPGAWNNIISYGTGGRWTSGTYADGIKWPAFGEIDYFEQAGGLAGENAYKTLHSGMHYGSGTGSGYNENHAAANVQTTTFDPTVFHTFKVEMRNGVYKCYIDNVLVHTMDGAKIKVTNAVLLDYHPFLKPMAFYLDPQAVWSAADKESTYEMIVDNMTYYDAEIVDPQSIALHSDTIDVIANSITLPVGGDCFLQHDILPAGANNKAVTWESSDESIFKVYAGYVKAYKEGSATLRAKSVQGSATSTITVNVSNSAKIPCKKVGFSVNSVDVDVEATGSVKSYVWPTFTTDDIVISCDDNGVATYDGITITPIADGTCVFTLTCGNYSAELQVNVVGSYGKDPIVSYSFDRSAVQDGVTIHNDGTLGSDYDLSVNYVNNYGNIVVNTVNNLTLPTRTAGLSYCIVMDLSDVIDRGDQNSLRDKRALFCEAENSANQPFIGSTFANAATKGNYLYAHNGKPTETFLDTPCRLAMWKMSNGVSYMYDSKSKNLQQTTDETYIKDIVKLKLANMLVDKLDIYYRSMRVNEVQELVNAYNE